MDFSEHMSLPTRAPPIATTFRRIVDIPFETCVAVVENWLGAVPHSDLHIGQSLLRAPIEHDRDSGTCRIGVRLARGPLRPLLPMRLNIDRWSWPPARTALELVPCQRVRPTAAYFRAGHLLLDSLTHSVPRHSSAQRFEHVPVSQPPTGQGLPRRSGRLPDQPLGPAPCGGSRYSHQRPVQPPDDRSAGAYASGGGER